MHRLIGCSLLMSQSIQLTAPKTRPDEVVERTAFPEKVTIWCAISSHGILGPYFYEENGSRVTVISSCGDG